MVFYNLKIFEKLPRLSEFIFRFVLNGFSGKIINNILKNVTSEFKMFPFSTDNIYDNVIISSSDDSGEKHMSENGNIWFTCNCPKNKENYVEVALNN